MRSIIPDETEIFFRTYLLDGCEVFFALSPSHENITPLPVITEEDSIAAKILGYDIQSVYETSEVNIYYVPRALPVSEEYFSLGELVDETMRLHDALFEMAAEIATPFSNASKIIEISKDSQDLVDKYTYHKSLIAYTLGRYYREVANPAV